MINTMNQMFGTDFEMKKIEKIKGLPVYMLSQRSIYEVSDKENAFILVKLADSEKFGVIALKKQQMQYEEKTNLPVAYWFENITRAQRDALIGHRIPFVADDKQMYLPFLGIAIHNSFRKKKEIKTEKMMPVTQSLFLCSRSKFLSKLLKTFDKTFREIFPVFISTKRREKPSAFFDNNFVNNAYFSEAASSSSSHLASSSSKAPISSRMTCLCLWSS